LCGEGDIRMLAVHHIDQDRKNYKVENLVWLCHNCHHLVHHYEVERRRLMEALV
jgi:5-methylcytosine-specific restriction endonuclease McrA